MSVYLSTFTTPNIISISIINCQNHISLHEVSLPPCWSPPCQLPSRSVTWLATMSTSMNGTLITASIANDISLSIINHKSFVSIKYLHSPGSHQSSWFNSITYNTNPGSIASHDAKNISDDQWAECQSLCSCVPFDFSFWYQHGVDSKEKMIKC